jgi:hypothetical protein
MKTTKKQADDAKGEQNELREHYDFDYGKAKPNRFAERLSKETTLVVLDPDVATVFRTSEAVNDALRVLITAAGNMPPAQHSVSQPQPSATISEDREEYARESTLDL